MLKVVRGGREAIQGLGGRARKLVLLLGGGTLATMVLFSSCTARVRPDELGVKQRRLASNAGVEDRVYGPGLYFVGPGTTLHTFPHTIHLLEASNDRMESRARGASARVEEYFSKRDALLGHDTHRTVDPLTVQTSDGYAVIAEVALLYSVEDPVKVAKNFGLGTAYVDSFVVNTFRNSVLTTLGKLNAESFYSEKERIQAVDEAEQLMRQRFAERGLSVQRLVLGSYSYASNYEKSLHDKKVAVQLAEQHRKESAVNEERAKLQQIESKGTANIMIAESEVEAQIAKVSSEASLYAAETRAKADREFGLAEAEAKRLKADALNAAGGRYVVALETAKMFDAVGSGVMTPEQYIQYIRASWALIGLSPGSAPPKPAAATAQGGTP